MARPSKYSREVRDRAVRMVGEHGPEHASQWAAIAPIASRIGCTGGPCGRAAAAADPRALSRRLKRANEILRKAAAAAQQELVQAVGERYREGTADAKRRILDEFVALTGYRRKHAIRVLNGGPGHRVP